MEKTKGGLKKNWFVMGVFVVIFGLSVWALIRAILLGDLMKIGLAVAALVLYFAPFIVTKWLKIRLPVALEVGYMLFVFASLILGEVFAFYGPFLWWDVVLHFLSGFVLAGVGFSLVEILAKGKQSRFFTLLFAFCFSITLGVAWECLEFSFDILVRTDAQKDAHLTQISTITLQRDGGNRPVRVDDIMTTDIHLADGETITIDNGYLDIGLMDTMKDLLINAVGAGGFLIFGMAIRRDKIKFIKTST